jgi:hypothetical protein
MKPASCLYCLAAAVMISLPGTPASAAPGQEGTLVRIVDGRTQVGIGRSSDKAGDDAIARMSALRTRVTERFLLRSHETTPFPPVRPITAQAPYVGKP